ncbi:5749_t:CDS:2 [Funneliformis caledonium]|uniref:5749_t:CDS:1 n=1 Tax=Funneliformis caledonium TaxID=1117310 RepID=A0A9N9B1T1_9GLOM|nr:5749_t:CDS:2 [Funneliformis caledonium]
MTNADDLHFMKIAIEQANLSVPIETAYCVGAALVKNSRLLSTGYSRELEGNTHAEECALKKLSDIKEANGAIMYTTMEPCSKRLSGNKPCVERIIEAGIKKVVMGIKEPDKFVKCEGISILQANGIEVVNVSELEEECKKINLKY